MNYQTGFWAMIMVFSVINQNTQIQPPDTNFKSIHQLQYEEQQKETLNDGQSKLDNNQQIKGIIDFSLMVIIILVLVIAISIFLIARRFYKIRR